MCKISTIFRRRIECLYVVFCMGQPNKDAAEIYEKLQNCLNKEGNKVVNLTSLIKELIKKYKH